MAGNYPDVPSWRMAYDVDGTQMFNILDGVISQYGSSVLSLFNNSSEDYYVVVDYLRDARQVVLIFPELRDLDAYVVLFQSGEGYASGLQVSSDTTNGLDGTWTTVRSGDFSTWDAVKPGMRTKISTTTSLGIKGLRFTVRYGGSPGGQARLKIAHFYGEPSPGENLHRLEIWHPTLDQRLGPADLDWGDVPRSTSEIREFRVKNMHPSLTANDVRVAMSIATDTSPSVVGQMSISQDGGTTWGAQQTLPLPLGPEAISPVLEIRRETPANAVLGLWDYRLFADATSWT